MTLLRQSSAAARAGARKESGIRKNRLQTSPSAHAQHGGASRTCRHCRPEPGKILADA